MQTKHLCAAPPPIRVIPKVVIVVVQDIVVSVTYGKTLSVGDTIVAEGEDAGTPGVWA